MGKILIAVDETQGSKKTLTTFRHVIRQSSEIILLHVQRLAGQSVIIDMLGDAEMATLKESVKGTEHKQVLERKAEQILENYKRVLEIMGHTDIKTITAAGRPVDEILRIADEESAELIVLGCNGKTLMQKLFTGCVTRDVQKSAKVPVLIAKTGCCEKTAGVPGGAYAAR